MANELLDFVMALVRDPDAAARYTADPAQAIADAHLTDVTSADVNNLIPVVSESLSTALPLAGAEPVNDGNVWATGAATEAFDAFAAVLPEPPADVYAVTNGLIHQPLDDLPGEISTYPPADSPVVPTLVSSEFDPAPHLDDGSALDAGTGLDSVPFVDDLGATNDAVDPPHPGLDIFE